MTTFPLALLILALTPLLTLGQLRWERLPPGPDGTNAPPSRRDAALGFDDVKNRLVVFGGRTEVASRELVLGDMWSYDLTAGTWRRLSLSTLPPARFGSVTGGDGRYFYLATGQGEHGVLFNDIWRLDLSSDKWEELPVQLPPPYLSVQQWRVAARHVTVPGLRVAGGGGIFPNASRFYVALGKGERPVGDLYSYDVHEKAWYTDVTEASIYDQGHPHARYGHAATMLSPHELLLAGGCLSTGGSGGACPSDDTWLFNAQTNVWKRIDSCSLPSMYGAMATLPIAEGKRYAVMYGGEHTSMQTLKQESVREQHVSVYDAGAEEWRAYVTEGAWPEYRASVAMVTGRDGIYMFGGKLSSGNMSAELYKLHGNSASIHGAPEATRCPAGTFRLILVHGVLMVLGYGFFQQGGAMIARYLLRARRHHKGYSVHVAFQVFGLFLVVAGFICAVLSTQGSHFSHSHGILGLVLVTLSLVQFTIALRRPHHDPTKETRKTAGRLVWEFVHSWLGRGILLLAHVNITLGLHLALAHPLLQYLWYAYLVALLVGYLSLECYFHCRGSRAGGKGEEGYEGGEGDRLGASMSRPNTPGDGRKYVYMVKDSNDGKGTFSRYSLNNPAFEH